jgi:hypothetical protein
MPEEVELDLLGILAGEVSGRLSIAVPERLGPGLPPPGARFRGSADRERRMWCGGSGRNLSRSKDRDLVAYTADRLS